jgi:nitrite reductase/ring-hydroxylating ferredoxin subunit/Fe-S cluster biogenesis protein NfuA
MSNVTTSAPTLATEDFVLLAERVDRAVGEVRGLPEDARRRALALKAAVEEVHKVGLTTIVRALKADPRGKELLFELVDDPAVRMLFAMHGLIRADVRTRAQRVIEMVRPRIQSHGGDVTLVDVEDGIALVRLSGSCTGCSMSAVTLRYTVEDALKEQCPEITAVRQLPAEPGEDQGQGHDDGHSAPVTVIQIGLPTRPGHLATSGWFAGPPVEQMSDERAVAVETPVGNVLLIKTKGGVRAYRNACAHQGLPLEGGMVDADAGTITCPWHGFRFDCDSGECLTAPSAQLEQFPVRVEDGVVWVRPE